jgi:Rhs element Vgr protein
MPSLSQTLPGTQNTDLVTFTLKVNGAAVSVQYQVALISISNEVNRIPTAKIMIYDGDAATQDFSVSNEETFIPGTELEITVGYHSDETSLFKGIILKHSLKIRSNGSPALILDCRDKFIKTTVARKNKYFYDKKDNEVAEEIIGTYGLDHDIQDTVAKLASIVQYDTTDWDFILSRMEANGKICIVSDGKITAKKPDFSATAVLDAVFGATIYELDAELDARNQYQGITAKTWDFANQQITSVSAAEPGFEENGNISSSAMGKVLSISEYDLYAGEEITQDELQNLADARLQQARMSRCRGRVRIRGFGGLNPGDLINIGGVGDRFSGKVFISGVRHEIANGVWNTDAQFGLSPDMFIKQPDISSIPAAGMLPGIQGLQIGIVTTLENDPDSQDRVRVRVPIIDDAEDGVWARVASLDAGNNRGTFFRPEVGDEVIVGFLNNDPRYPVLLGMLNSSAKPAPLTASDQNDEKGYVSRSGMKMIFNDKDKSLKIETPAGKKITVSESDGVMTLEDENKNKISMDSSAVSIESGADISIKATGDIKMEAANIKLTPSSGFTLSAGGEAKLSGSSVTVDSSGVATIKGSLVKIN